MGARVGSTILLASGLVCGHLTRDLGPDQPSLESTDCWSARTDQYQFLKCAKGFSTGLSIVKVTYCDIPAHHLT